MMPFDSRDKRVLVTGGTRGIGRDIVEAFLETGARVALNGSNIENNTNAITEFAAGERVAAAPGFVATADGCRAVVEAAVGWLGGIDILINNAGIGGEHAEAHDEELWDGVVDTNLKGVFFVTKHALPALRQSKGTMVNFVSVDGLVGIVGELAYSALKAGVIYMTRGHALEFGPDIRVNAVCLELIDTDMLRGAAVSEGGRCRSRVSHFCRGRRGPTSRGPCEGDCWASALSRVGTG